MIEFGSVVKVRRIAHRFKQWGSNTVRVSHRDSIRYGVDAMDKPWPGIAIPGSEVDESLHRAVYVRRIPVEPLTDHTGIVVGHTWREEGYIETDRGGPYDEGYGNVLISARRIPLYEVALQNGSMGKADLVLAHELDLETL